MDDGPVGAGTERGRRGRGACSSSARARASPSRDPSRAAPNGRAPAIAIASPVAAIRAHATQLRPGCTQAHADEVEWRRLIVAPVVASPSSTHFGDVPRQRPRRSQPTIALRACSAPIPADWGSGGGVGGGVCGGRAAATGPLLRCASDQQQGGIFSSSHLRPGLMQRVPSPSSTRPLRLLSLLLLLVLALIASDACTRPCAADKPDARHGSPRMGPVAVLDGPTRITDCDVLQLDGVRSHVRGGGGDMQYLWSIASVESANGAPLSPALALNLTQAVLGVELGRFNDASHRRLSIPPTQLPANLTYTFALRISEGVTTSSPALLSVHKDGTASGAPWLPAVVLTPPSALLRSKQARFLVDLVPSQCASPPPDAILSFEWSVIVRGAPSWAGSDPWAPPLGSVVLHSSVRNLIVLARTLRVGFTYEFTLTLTGSSASSSGSAGRRLLTTLGSTSSSTTLTVSPSALVASIVGSDREHRSDLAQLVLDASASHDPDAASVGDKSSFRVRWECMVAPSHVGSTGVVAGPLQLPASSSSQLLLVVPSSLLQVGATYTCTASLCSVASDPSRNSSASISVRVLAAPSLPTPLVTILNAPSSLNPATLLVLQSSVVSTSSTAAHNLLYTWDCVSDPGIDLHDPEMLGGKPAMPNLILRPGVLGAGRRYEFRLTVRDPLHSTTSSTSASVYVNAPPFGGRCFVEPGEGVALHTVFELSCQGWHDPQDQLPFVYQFACIDESRGSSSSTSSSPQLLDGALQSASHLATKLPSGSLRLVAYVRDGAGATAVYFFPSLVQVSLPALALSDPTCYVANMSATLLDSTVQQQDSDAAFLVIQQLAGVLNTAPANASSTCGGNDTAGRSVTDLRNSLLESLGSLTGSGNGSTPMDLGTATLVSQSLASLTSSPQAMASNSTWTLSHTILEVAIAALAKNGGAGGGDSASAELAASLGTTLSQMLVDCSRMDQVGDMTQSLLSALLGGSVSGQSQVLNTSSLQATATRSDLSAGISVTLASGVSVTLTPEALAQYAVAAGYQTVNVSTFGTAASAPSPLFLDTRIVQWDSRWLTCRNGSTGANGEDSFTSPLTHIDITLSDGQVVDITQLDTPITFFIPVGRNATALYLEQTAAVAAAALAAGCPVPPVLPPTAASLGLSCSYRDRTGNWTEEGCVTVGLTSDLSNPRIECLCGHRSTSQRGVRLVGRAAFAALGATATARPAIHRPNGMRRTEFAIIHRRDAAARAAQAAATRGCGLGSLAAVHESVLGLSMYLVFFVLYMLVALTSGVQLARVLLSTGCKHWLMTAEHALVLCLSLTRGLNMMVFYELYRYLSPLAVSLLSGLPYLFLSWIFTFVIFAWASIFHSDHAGRRDENPFSSYLRRFIVLNSLVSGALFALAVAMAVSRSSHRQSVLYQSGTALIAAVDIGFAIFFLIYGLLLVRSLTKDFSSPYARKLLVVALLLSLSFASSSVIQLLSVINESMFSPYLNELNAAYFSLDLFALCIILALFAKSVSESAQASSSPVHAQSRRGRSVISTTVHNGAARSQKQEEGGGGGGGDGVTTRHAPSEKSALQAQQTRANVSRQVDGDDADSPMATPVLSSMDSPMLQLYQPRLAAHKSLPASKHASIDMTSRRLSVARATTPFSERAVLSMQLQQPVPTRAVSSSSSASSTSLDGGTGGKPGRQGTEGGGGGSGRDSADNPGTFIISSDMQELLSSPLALTGLPRSSRASISTGSSSSQSGHRSRLSVLTTPPPPNRQDSAAWLLASSGGSQRHLRYTPLAQAQQAAAAAGAGAVGFHRASSLSQSPQKPRTPGTPSRTGHRPSLLDLAPQHRRSMDTLPMTSHDAHRMGEFTLETCVPPLWSRGGSGGGSNGGGSLGASPDGLTSEQPGVWPSRAPTPASASGTTSPVPLGIGIRTDSAGGKRKSMHQLTLPPGFWLHRRDRSRSPSPSLPDRPLMRLSSGLGSVGGQRENPVTWVRSRSIAGSDATAVANAASAAAANATTAAAAAAAAALPATATAGEASPVPASSSRPSSRVPALIAVSLWAEDDVVRNGGLDDTLAAEVPSSSPAARPTTPTAATKYHSPRVVGAAGDPIVDGTPLPVDGDANGAHMGVSGVAAVELDALLASPSQTGAGTVDDADLFVAHPCTPHFDAADPFVPMGVAMAIEVAAPSSRSSPVPVLSSSPWSTATATTSPPPFGALELIAPLGRPRPASGKAAPAPSYSDRRPRALGLLYSSSDSRTHSGVVRASAASAPSTPPIGAVPAPLPLIHLDSSAPVSASVAPRRGRGQPQQGASLSQSLRPSPLQAFSDSSSASEAVRPILTRSAAIVTRSTPPRHSRMPQPQRSPSTSPS